MPVRNNPREGNNPLPSPDDFLAEGLGPELEDSSVNGGSGVNGGGEQGPDGGSGGDGTDGTDPANGDDPLRAYAFHGVDLTPPRRGATQAVGVCPFCWGEGKFHVCVKTGKWDCKSCASGNQKGGGNVYTFLRLLWAQGGAPDEAMQALAQDRRLDVNTLDAWGVVPSNLTGEWMVPGYNAEGALTQLYVYRDDGNGRRRLLPTPGFPSGQGHALHMPALAQHRPPPGKTRRVYVCEGPWDAMALWEALGRWKLKIGMQPDDVNLQAGHVLPTGTPATSLRSEALVVGVPGANVWRPAWNPLLSGTDTVLLYDNDHPRRSCNKCKKQHYVPDPTRPSVCPTCRATLNTPATDGAGLAGMRRVAGLLAAHPEPPARLRWLAWGPRGYSPVLPTGTDVRDLLTADPDPDPRERAAAVAKLLTTLQPIPPEWVEGRSAEAVAEGDLHLEPLPCDGWLKLRNQARKALKWTPGLDRALRCMLASVVSVATIGQQVWFLVLAPPSSGKSTLCEAMAVCRKHVICKSELRSLFSGFKADKEGSEDFSIVPHLHGKTLVVKDIDPLLKSPNRGQVLGQLRDLYDGATRSHFNNGMGKDYGNIRTTILLCGTGAARELDAAELGARYLTVTIMEGIDLELEQEVKTRVAHRAWRNRAVAADGQPGTQDTPEMVAFKQLTGGFVEHLRANATQLLAQVQATDEQLEEVSDYGTLVAFLRARPSRKQDEVAEREFSSRLVEQFIRLTACLAAVEGKDSVDAEVMDTVRQVALDTARGRSLDLARHLYAAGDKGMESDWLANATHEEPVKLAPLLVFLRKIGAVEYYRPGSVTLPGGRTVQSAGAPRWRLSPLLRTLYGRAVGTSITGTVTNGG